MKRLLVLCLAIIVGLGGYLLLWPVPIDPVVWEAPVNRGYVGDFKPNTRLANMDRLSIGAHNGPEDVVIWNGDLIVGAESGEILKVKADGSGAEVLANTGGHPLGLEVDPNTNDLLIADAYIGLLALSKDGNLRTLTDEVDGTPIAYADDLDIGADGVIYFSDASTKFGAKASNSTLGSSLLEIMEHGRTGRLLAYDPATKTTRVVAGGFSFSNGVAMHPSGDILVNETGEYKVVRVNAETGAKTDFIFNLPGFPDNINPGPDGTFYLGIISQRSDFLDEAAGNSGARKLALRLPEFMRPSAVSYTLIVQLDAEGNVLQTYQDPDGAYPNATGAILGPDGYLYVSSLTADTLARTKLEN